MAILRTSNGWGIAGIAAWAFGIAAALCWKNQKIRILDEETFVYTTMFGRKKIYRFEDIIALKRNRDSFTLIMKGGKVHIESTAILSDRLIEKIGGAFTAKE